MACRGILARAAGSANRGGRTSSSVMTRTWGSGGQSAGVLAQAVSASLACCVPCSHANGTPPHPTLAPAAWA